MERRSFPGHVKYVAAPHRRFFSMRLKSHRVIKSLVWSWRPSLALDLSSLHSDLREESVGTAVIGEIADMRLKQKALLENIHLTLVFK